MSKNKKGKSKKTKKAKKTEPEMLLSLLANRKSIFRDVTDMLGSNVEGLRVDGLFLVPEPIPPEPTPGDDDDDQPAIGRCTYELTPRGLLIRCPDDDDSGTGLPPERPAPGGVG